MTLNKLRKLLGGAISVAGAVVLVAQHLEGAAIAL